MLIDQLVRPRLETPENLQKHFKLFADKISNSSELIKVKVHTTLPSQRTAFLGLFFLFPFNLGYSVKGFITAHPRTRVHTGVLTLCPHPSSLSPPFPSPVFPNPLGSKTMLTWYYD